MTSYVEQHINSFRQFIYSLQRDLMELCYGIVPENEQSEKKKKAENINVAVHRIKKLDIDIIRSWSGYGVKDVFLEDDKLIMNAFITYHNYYYKHYYKKELVDMIKKVYMDSEFINVCKVFPKYAWCLYKNADRLDSRKVSLIYNLFCQNESISVSLTPNELKEAGVNILYIDSTDINSSTEIIILSKNQIRQEISSDSFQKPCSDAFLTLKPYKCEKGNINNHNSKDELVFIFEAISNYTLLGTQVSKNIKAVSKKYTYLTNRLTDQEIETYRQKMKKLYYKKI